MPPLTTDRRAFTVTSLSLITFPATSTPLQVSLPNVQGLDPSQSWFWSNEWQARVREAEEDLRLGRYRDFDTMDDFIASLDDPVDDE